MGILFTQAAPPLLLGKLVNLTRGLNAGVPVVGFKIDGYSKFGKVVGIEVEAITCGITW
jgi:hypothetical protein